MGNRSLEVRFIPALKSLDNLQRLSFFIGRPLTIKGGITVGLFGKKKEDNGPKPLEKYQVIYKGGLPEYSKSKASGINFLLFEDRLQFTPTMGSKSWFSELTIPYSNINDITIESRIVGTAEALLGGLDSRQLDHKNNIHIKFTYSGRPTILRLEMLTGVTVMGQAAKCKEFEDRLLVHGIREKFARHN